MARKSMVWRLTEDLVVGALAGLFCTVVSFVLTAIVFITVVGLAP